jgi:hypothetical protein
MNTLVEYMYRDASNYKELDSFVLGGRFDISMIERFLSDHEFFIPERVGVKALVPATKTPDDHYLHTIEATIETDDAVCLMSANTFVVRMEQAAREGWFYEKLSAKEALMMREMGRKAGLANPDWDEW